ncbi:MAG: glycine/sarcosine/betaine reductase component B subunit [Maledivibacter sp.]|jgi:glycine reductase|nr:glycine/sarcosine/betaine reductase component B subunit [Maledivibacter sp.]
MKLTMENLEVKDIQFADNTYFKDGILYVCKKELLNHVKDEPLLKEIEFNIVRPGDSARVIEILDAIEPRCKVGDDYNNWPGHLNESFKTAGQGTTRALKGMSVLTCNFVPSRIMRHGISLDMSGEYAAYSPYSKLVNLVTEIKLTDDDTLKAAIKTAAQANYEPGEEIVGFFAKTESIPVEERFEAIKRIKLKISTYIAQKTLDVQADSIEVFDNETRYPNLPRVGYALQLVTEQYNCDGYSESMFYGYPIQDNLPWVVEPTEVLDGAIAQCSYGRYMLTYEIQNAAVIKDLFREHGKTFDFVGMVLTSVSSEAKRRNLTSQMVGNIMKETLKVDGAIFTKCMGGAPTICMGLAASACEDRGIHTVEIQDAFNPINNMNSEMIFNDIRVGKINHSVSFGNAAVGNRMVMDKIYGGIPETPVWGVGSGSFYTYDKEQVNTFESQSSIGHILGAIAYLGGFNMRAVEY